MSRTATVTRKTRETNITVTLDLDGSGKADLHTGIGFFDHMLDGFARHGLFDLTLHCDGDLNVDCHHTIEDCGIALGMAIREALGDKALGEVAGQQDQQDLHADPDGFDPLRRYWQLQRFHQDSASSSACRVSSSSRASIQVSSNCPSRTLSLACSASRSRNSSLRAAS